MATRTLTTGQVVPELDKAVTLTVYTKCPEKYKLVDMETGEEYIGQDNSEQKSWKKIKENDGILRQGS